MKPEMIFCFVAVLLLALCMGCLLLEYRRLKKAFEGLEAAYKNLEALNSELRSQRHDYRNHLQVVYGLMELKEYEELRRYLQPVYKRILKTGKALKTTKPAINALLKAKMDEAESRNIDFYVEVKSDLKGFFVEDWELCKVLSNLLDNGMTALEELSGEKKLLLDISENHTHYQFAVSNNGPVIPLYMRDEIFKQGISSKKEAGHGMGLYIVKNIVKKYGGEVHLTSQEDETEFLIKVPKGQKGEVWNT